MRKRSTEKAYDKEHEPLFNLDLPEIKPISWKTGLLITGGVVAIGLGVGVAIGTLVFFSTASMIGFALLAENNRAIQWFVINGNQWIDVGIFAMSIYALASLGPTIAGGMAIMGIQYTAIYAPLMRDRHKRRKERL